MNKEKLDGFIRWAQSEGFSTKLRNDPYSHDTFFNFETEKRWLTWQAATADHERAILKALEGASRYSESDMEGGGVYEDVDGPLCRFDEIVSLLNGEGSGHE